MFRLYFLISFFICVQSCDQTCGNSSVPDHYWRDYYGTIPPDAIPADDTKNVYIGQVYIHGCGLRVGTIIPGSKEVETTCYGVLRINLMIKILCAKDHSKYIWVKTTAGTSKKDLEGQSPLVSGYNRKFAFVNEGILNIGRTCQNGRTIIGNTAACYPDNPLFYYPLNGREITDQRTTQYEVLVYRNTPPKAIFEKNKSWIIL